MAASFQNAVRVSKDVDIDDMNEMRRLDFGGALSPTFFLESVLNLKEFIFVNINSHFYHF